MTCSGRPRRTRRRAPAVEPSWALVGVIAAGVALGNAVPAAVNAVLAGVLIAGAWLF